MFQRHIHTFRAVAILSVVATHGRDNLVWDASWSHRLILSVVENGTVPFVFVAGFLFAHLSGRFRYGDYLGKKLRWVILPYAITSLPALWLCYRNQPELWAGASSPAAEAWRAMELLATGRHQPAPMWFIPMIAIIYVAAPLLLVVDRRRLYPFVVPPLLCMALFAHRPVVLTHVGHALLYFGPVYLTGMWCARHHERVLDLVDRHLALVFAVTLALVSVEVFELGRGGALKSAAPFSTEHGLVDLNLPTKLLLSLALLALLRRAPEALHRGLDTLAGASFGVFFLHRTVLYGFAVVLAHVGIDAIPGNPATLLAVVLVTTAVALALIWVCRRVLGERSRLVVGC